MMYRSSRAKQRKAFTLVEVLVAISLSLIVLTSMVVTFMVFASGSRRVAAYTEMSQQSRHALEVFARDMRAANDVLEATQMDLVLQYPETSFYDATTVEYRYDSSLGVVRRIERAKAGDINAEDTVLAGVAQFAFDYFDPLGGQLAYSKESLLLSIKSVRVDAEMLRTVSQAEASDYIISARFMMRNRPVTE